MNFQEMIALARQIPGAENAIAAIIGSIGELGAATVRIGTAKAKQISSEIEQRAETDRRLSQAMTGAAETYIREHAGEVGQRALEAWTKEQVRKQVSREAVSVLALEYLSEKPPEHPSADPISEDWLSIFASYVERASSERMQHHWAQILAGEIRRPGSFSLAALQLASVMDQQTAQLIEEMCGWIVEERFIPTVAELNKGELYTKLLALDDIGFLKLGRGSFFFTGGPSGHVELETKSSLVTGVTQPGRELTLPCAFLSRSGRELLPVISRRENPKLLPLLERFMSEKGVTKVQIVAKNA